LRLVSRSATAGESEREARRSACAASARRAAAACAGDFAESASASASVIARGAGSSAEAAADALARASAAAKAIDERAERVRSYRRASPKGEQAICRRAAMRSLILGRGPLRAVKSGLRRFFPWSNSPRSELISCSCDDFALTRRYRRRMARFERPSDIIAFDLLESALRSLPAEDASRIVEDALRPHVFSLRRTVLFATWVFETLDSSSRDREAMLHHAGVIDRVKELGLVKGERGATRTLVAAEIRSLLEATPAADRAHMAKELWEGALRHEAEEVREEVGGSAADEIREVVWTSDSRPDKRPEAWVVRLHDGRWAAMVYPAKGRPKRIWYAGSRDDALAVLPVKWFDEAGAAAVAR
jgi:hypothetical protein